MKGVVKGHLLFDCQEMVKALCNIYTYYVL